MLYPVSKLALGYRWPLLGARSRTGASLNRTECWTFAEIIWQINISRPGRSTWGVQCVVAEKYWSGNEASEVSLVPKRLGAPHFTCWFTWCHWMNSLRHPLQCVSWRTAFPVLPRSVGCSDSLRGVETSKAGKDWQTERLETLGESTASIVHGSFSLKETAVSVGKIEGVRVKDISQASDTYISHLIKPLLNL